MKKILMFIVFISVVILPTFVLAEDTISDKVTLSSCVDENSVRFMLGLKEIKVKFLGISADEKIVDDETDEINESLVKDYVCSLFTGSSNIRIEYDPKASREDKYGRIQAWVFVDDILLQEDLVNLGYAKIMYLEDNYLYADRLKTAQKTAREKGLGIWKDKPLVIEEQEDEEVVHEKKSKGIFEMIIDFFVDVFRSIISFIDGIIDNIL